MISTLRLTSRLIPKVEEHSQSFLRDVTSVKMPEIQILEEIYQIILMPLFRKATKAEKFKRKSKTLTLGFQVLGMFQKLRSNLHNNLIFGISPFGKGPKVEN